MAENNKLLLVHPTHSSEVGFGVRGHLHLCNATSHRGREKIQRKRLALAIPHVTSIHISLAQISHMSAPNCNGTGNPFFSMPRNRGRRSIGACLCQQLSMYLFSITIIIFVITPINVSPRIKLHIFNVTQQKNQFLFEHQWIRNTA